MKASADKQAQALRLPASFMAASGLSLIYIAIFAFLFLIPSCGGGTTGTGGTGSGSLQVEGRVIESGEWIASSQITVLETGDSGTTDSNGEFTIATVRSGSIITLLLELVPREVRVELQNVTEDTVRITVVIEVARSTNQVNADVRERTDFRATPTHRPSATRTAAAGRTPAPPTEMTTTGTATATPNPLDTPGVSPQPTNTATPVPPSHPTPIVVPPTPVSTSTATRPPTPTPFEELPTATPTPPAEP